MKLEQIIIVAIAAALVIISLILALRFSSFKNWLVYAVSEAEKQFGGKTGKLKLRYVYDLAMNSFPTLVKLIPFGLFSSLVDYALVIMRGMLESNPAIASAIQKDSEDAKSE